MCIKGTSFYKEGEGAVISVAPFHFNLSCWSELLTIVVWYDKRSVAMMSHLDDISFNENCLVELLHPFRSLLLIEQVHEDYELMFLVSQSATPFASWRSLWPYTHIYVITMSWMTGGVGEVINKLWSKQGEGWKARVKQYSSHIFFFTRVALASSLFLYKQVLISWRWKLGDEPRLCNTSVWRRLPVKH